MQQNIRLQSLKDFHFSEEEIFYSELKRVYKRRILNLKPLSNQFEYVNALCTDGKKYLLIGTEEGTIFVFSLKENKMIGTIKGVRWIYSLLVTYNRIFAVGQSRIVKCFNLRSLRATYYFPQSEEGYGSKGIKLSDTEITNKIIANVGYGKFNIFDAVKLKVIYCFDIAWDTLKEIKSEHTTIKPTVINYCVIKRFFKVCYILDEDGHVYFYNYKQHKLLRKIRLFDYQEMITNNQILANSLILEQDGFLFIVLQFSNNRIDNVHLKSVLCVVRVFKIGEHKKIDVLFFARLFELEFVNSKSVTRSPCKEGEALNKFHMILGTARGVSMTYIVDIEKKVVTLHDRIIKSKESDTISATIFYNNGTIASTGKGKIIHILNKLNAQKVKSLN